VEKSEGKERLIKPNSRWKNNIKMDFKQISLDGLDWIELAQKIVKWRAVVNTEMNRQIP
jgi:hypothetical protein